MADSWEGSSRFLVLIKGTNDDNRISGGIRLPVIDRLGLNQWC